MAATGRPDEPATPASDVAASCRDAGLVHLVGAADGAALAAVGLLGRALADADRPFQARLAPPEAVGSPGATDADCTIAVRRPDLDADHTVDATATDGLAERAYAIAAELGTADPALGLAGTRAAGADPAGRIHEDAQAAGIDRRPGVAVPTADLADGLAHTTLVHAPFSGDPDAAAAALADLDLPADPSPDDRRRIASLVALAVAETEACPPQATRAVERVLHPFVGGPVETIGGYADLLDALARTSPGLGIAIALGRTDPTAGLDPWREHGRLVHDAVDSAAVERHDGLVVARAKKIEAAVTLGPVARLLRDYRSPEPTVLAFGTDAAVLATVDDAVDAHAVLADACNDETVPGDDGAAASETVDDEPSVGETVVGDGELATVPTVEGTADHDALVEAVRRAVR